VQVHFALYGFLCHLHASLSTYAFKRSAVLYTRPSKIHMHVHLHSPLHIVFYTIASHGWTVQRVRHTWLLPIIFTRRINFETRPTRAVTCATCFDSLNTLNSNSPAGQRSTTHVCELNHDTCNAIKPHLMRSRDKRCRQTAIFCLLMVAFADTINVSSPILHYIIFASERNDAG
jgi:hypothetical protein